MVLLSNLNYRFFVLLDLIKEVVPLSREFLYLGAGCSNLALVDVSFSLFHLFVDASVLMRMLFGRRHFGSEEVVLRAVLYDAVGGHFPDFACLPDIADIPVEGPLLEGGVLVKLLLVGALLVCVDPLLHFFWRAASLFCLER